MARALDKSEGVVKAEISATVRFYSNDIVDSTSIDVFLICGFAGFVCAVVFFITGQVNLAYVGAYLITIALTRKSS